MLNKKIKVLLISVVSTCAFYSAYKSSDKQQQVTLSNLVLMNLQALSEELSGESGNGVQTFQIAEVVEIVSGGGWTFNAKLNVWLLNGKVQSTPPPNSRKITYKCCRPQGDVKECNFEKC